jgi:hypothetical protein
VALLRRSHAYRRRKVALPCCGIAQDALGAGARPFSCYAGNWANPGQDELQSRLVADSDRLRCLYVNAAPAFIADARHLFDLDGNNSPGLRGREVGVAFPKE